MGKCKQKEGNVGWEVEVEAEVELGWWCGYESTPVFRWSESHGEEVTANDNVHFEAWIVVRVADESARSTCVCVVQASAL